MQQEKRVDDKNWLLFMLQQKLTIVSLLSCRDIRFMLAADITADDLLVGR